ncbi:MAG: hypothetical protein EOP84_16535 [Verrucomicrobiaceae bacterium]|nr:MAG: hypothetical protein EOP84_16535 [Verrucomicrobiaceae bacterium]
METNQADGSYIERRGGRWRFHLERELVEQRPAEVEKVVRRLRSKLEQTLQLFPSHARERLYGLQIFVMLGPEATGGGRDNEAEYFRRTDCALR